MRQRWIVTGLFCLFVTPGSFAEPEITPLEQSRLYRQQAGKAYGAGDLAGAYDGFHNALQVIPNHPGMIFNLAAISFEQGEIEKGLDWLERYAAMGLVTNLAQFQGIEGLADHPRLEKIATRMTANREPVGEPVRALVVPDKIRIAEDIAYDQAGGRYFISSVAGRAIYEVDAAGDQKILVDGARLGISGITGMTLDPEAGLLWFASAGLEPVPDLEEDQRNHSAIYAVDMQGDIIHRIEMPGSGHLFGDLILASDGSLFVSDSGERPAIFHLDPEQGEFAEIAGGPAYGSMQGLALSADEQSLYFADYSTGIYRLDMADHTVTALTPPRDAALLGIDGLYVYQGNLIAIQNGVNPHRVIRIRLGKDGQSIRRAETLIANHPVIADPTLGIIRNDDFLFVANSQWPKFGREVPEMADLDQIVILQIELLP